MSLFSQLLLSLFFSCFLFQKPYITPHPLSEATGLGFVLLLSTLVCCQPIELILVLFCYKNFNPCHLDFLRFTPPPSHLESWNPHHDARNSWAPMGDCPRSLSRRGRFSGLDLFNSPGLGLVCFATAWVSQVFSQLCSFWRFFRKFSIFSIWQQQSWFRAFFS